MAVLPMSPGGNYDQLWKQSSLEDIRQVQRRLHSDAAAKVEELRCLIGDKFRDLLHTTDSICDMKLELDSAVQEIHDLRLLFDDIDNIVSNAKSAAIEKAKSEEQNRDRLHQSKQDQVTALFTAERVWEGMDAGRLQHSVEEYFKGLRALEQLDNRTDPFWVEQSELVHDLPRQLKQLCCDRLIEANEPLRDEDALRAIVAIEGLDWREALHSFLDCRLKGMQQLIASGDEHDRFAYTLRLTLSECYNWLGEPGKIALLGQDAINESVSIWFQDSIRDLILQDYSAVLLAYSGDKLASVRDQILNVLFQYGTNSWPFAVTYCLGSDIHQIWQSIFYEPLKNALLHHALHMFDRLPDQLIAHLVELEPSIDKVCNTSAQQVATRHRRNSTFWRQITDMNQNTSDPYLILVESIGERFNVSLRSLSQTSHALLDSSVASSFKVADLVDLMTVTVRNDIEQSCLDALSKIAGVLEQRVLESENVNRSVLFGRISQRFWSSAVCVKSLIHPDKFNEIQSRYSATRLKAYQLWTNANASSITVSLRDRVESSVQLWNLPKSDQISSTWATVGDVQVPCNASPFAMSFLYDLNREIQTLHCAEFDAFINAHICAGICDQVATIIRDNLESVKSLSQPFKSQFLFDVLFIFAQIGVPSHILSSHGISSISSTNAAAAIREVRCLIEPVVLAASDQALRESVRVQSARCSVIFGSIFYSIPSLNSKTPSQSLNRVANIAPLLSRDTPRLPSLPVNLYGVRELKRRDFGDDIADSETHVSSMPTYSPTSTSIGKRESRSGLSSGVATSATKWLADASLGLSTATSGLSSMFKHYSKQQHQ